MPAPSLAALLNFEGQLTFAARSILAAGGFTEVFARGRNQAKPDSYVAVTVNIAAASGRLGLRPSAATEPAHFRARLSVIVAVRHRENEPDEAATGTALDQRLGAIRALFLNHPNPFAAYQAEQGVYLQVNAIVPAAAEYDVVPSADADVCVLNWDLEFLIPDDAWPS